MESLSVFLFIPRRFVRECAKAGAVLVRHHCVFVNDKYAACRWLVRCYIDIGEREEFN
jgi:hypothetical protein